MSRFLFAAQSYIEPREADDDKANVDTADVSADDVTSQASAPAASPVSSKSSACKTCGREFRSAVLQRRHAQRCLVTSAHRCGFCDARFARDEHLQAHMSLLHAVDVWEQMKERLAVFLDM